MKRGQKVWVYSPRKPAKPKVPESVKRDLAEKAEKIVETVLKPQYIKPPPEDEQFNYIVDIYTKWYRSYFYFCSKYRCPGPNAISPYFDDRFARLEYVGNGLFNVAFMRYTGQWMEIDTDLTMDESLAAIQEEAWFHP